MLINNIEEILNKLTLKEKAQLLVGYRSMNTMPIERLNIPPLNLSDGPNGLRKEAPEGDSLSGVATSYKSTCFPCGATLACSWNKDNFYKMGQAIASECKHYDVNVLLGPAINIKRNPRCGRNFEYLSEDPFLTGELASSFIMGLQDNGVGACVKHFVCNENENYRYTGSSWVDQKALHEIYLKPFEMVVKKAHPYALMTSYNQVNGEFASQNGYIQNTLLRDSWGFDGLSMTDWGGSVDRVKGLLNGTDLEMPGMLNYNIQSIINAYNNKEISMEDIDKSLRRLFETINKTENTDEEDTCDFKINNEVAIDLATDSAVLLENDGILPLSKDKKYLVVGDLFRLMRYQGSGSALLNPYFVTGHDDAFKLRNINYEFVRGYEESSVNVNEALHQEALAKAQDYDTILFYGGLNDYIESEGFDRDDTQIPLNQVALINDLTKLGKKVVVVLFGGSSMAVPFASSVNAILNMLLPGQGGGEATTRLLFGEACPNGRLMETWMKDYSDVPFYNEYTISPNELYKESIYVGYRYYLSAGKEERIQYPFGYGLSYTNFEITSAKIRQDEDRFIIHLNVKNIGEVEGAETLQVYVSHHSDKTYRPLRELKAFGKAYLKPNESQEVILEVMLDDLKAYDVKERCFKLEAGKYDFEIGLSSTNILLQKTFDVEGEELEEQYNDQVRKFYFEPQNLLKVTNSDFENLLGMKVPSYEVGKKPYTMETPINEFNTFFGKIFKKIIINMGHKQYKKGCKEKDPLTSERMKKAGLFLEKLMPKNSLRSLSNSSSGLLKHNQAVAILHLSNGHLFKGLYSLMKKDKISIK